MDTLAPSDLPATLGELKASGYQPKSIKQEIRGNLIEALKQKKDLFPGILGYEGTVLPEITNAILSQHDMLLLGLRGQGKTKILRMMVSLLDEYMPVVAGSEIQDDPLSPVSFYAREIVETQGNACPIEWVHKEDRFTEKLATPDVTISDLIGEIDLVKHARGKELSNEDVMHFGLIPRSHRGIFCLNELPDLSPKIQVGLFNILEERDIQIRGFTIRLPIDVFMVFSANPEDYTNRGRIVTPLKDRIGSVVKTHYPLDNKIGMQITRENAIKERIDGKEILIPGVIEEIIEETSRLARTSPHVNQASGVSVRMSITNYENACSNAEQRAIINHENFAFLRISDLSAIAAGSRGKMELAMTEETGEEDLLIQRILSEAIKNVFDQHSSSKDFRAIGDFLGFGDTIVINDRTSTTEILEKPPWKKMGDTRKKLESLAAKLDPKLAESHPDEMLLVSLELMLEGLYAHNKCNKTRTDAGGIQFG